MVSMADFTAAFCVTFTILVLSEELGQCEPLHQHTQLHLLPPMALQGSECI